MKALVIYIMRFGLNVIYFFMKLRPTDKKRVLFLSRQSDTLTEDFKILLKTVGVVLFGKGAR